MIDKIIVTIKFGLLHNYVGFTCKLIVVPLPITLFNLSDTDYAETAVEQGTNADGLLPQYHNTKWHCLLAFIV